MAATPKPAGFAASTTTSNISDLDLQLLRLVKIITVIGRNIMFWVFHHVYANNDPNKTMESFLKNDVGLSNTEYKKSFNKTAAVHLKSSELNKEKFDISLLYVLLQVACGSKMASKNDVKWTKKDETILENNLYRLKNERNNLMHNLTSITKREVEDKMNELQRILVAIVETASVRVGLNQTTTQEELKNLSQDVNHVINQPLTEEEKAQSWMILLSQMAVSQIKELARKLQNLNPVSYLSDFDVIINLQSVLSTLIIIPSDECKAKEIDYESVLAPDKNGSSKLANLLLVRGVAGSGKSTLIKMLMGEWCNPDTNIQDLNTYDLVVYMECRHHQADSLAKLLRNILPEYCATYNDKSLMLVLQQKTLFIIDGLDEMNDNSCKVVYEILDFSKTKNHTVFCTSRPERTIEFLKRVPSEFCKTIMEVKGIPDNEQCKFVKRYHEQLREKGVSDQSTEDLVDYVERSRHSNHFYNIPSNLVLLTFLWAKRPDMVSKITTATELYLALRDMLEENLEQRMLNRHPMENVDLVELRNKINSFWQVLCLESLTALSRSEIILQTSSTKRMKKTCNEQGFDFQEVASAFLVTKIVKKGIKREEQLSFPHKDNQDFCAAQAIVLAITNSDFFHMVMETFEVSQSKRREGSICSVLQAVHREYRLDVNRYQNVLKHVAGLLTVQVREVKKSTTQELVALIVDSGVQDQDQWLAILSETKCDQQTAQLIAESFFRSKTYIKLTSSQVSGFATLMPFLNPHKVILNLADDPKRQPRLSELLAIISENNCQVLMYIWHHFYHPNPSSNSDPLLQILLHQNSKCHLVRLVGHVSCVSLPSTVMELYLALSTDQGASYVLPTLRNLPRLECLRLHVAKGVSTTAISQLRDKRGINVVHLYVSGVGQGGEARAVELAQQLQPLARYECLWFPLSTLEVSGWRRLVEELYNEGVKLWGSIMVPSPTVTKEELEELNKLTRPNLRCTFLRMDKRENKPWQNP